MRKIQNIYKIYRQIAFAQIILSAVFTALARVSAFQIFHNHGLMYGIHSAYLVTSGLVACGVFSSICAKRFHDFQFRMQKPSQPSDCSIHFKRNIDRYSANMALRLVSDRAQAVSELPTQLSPLVAYSKGRNAEAPGSQATPFGPAKQSSIDRDNPIEAHNTASLRPISEELIDRLLGRVVSLSVPENEALDQFYLFFGDIDSAHLVSLREWAGPQREILILQPELDVCWNDLTAVAGRATICFIDADFLGDTEETVDFCLRLKKCSFQTPQILISSEVREHDLTAERLAICDATLKPPLTSKILQQGVVAACQNCRSLDEPSLDFSRFSKMTF